VPLIAPDALAAPAAGVSRCVGRWCRMGAAGSSSVTLTVPTTFFTSCNSFRSSSMALASCRSLCTAYSPGAAVRTNSPRHLSSRKQGYLGDDAKRAFSGSELTKPSWFGCSACANYTPGATPRSGGPLRTRRPIDMTCAATSRRAIPVPLTAICESQPGHSSVIAIAPATDRRIPRQNIQRE
jgi:hypothetical protein